MENKNNYYVIGGQYQRYFHGATSTLPEAKRLAEESIEFWDNWQGWHVPAIYRAEDVREISNFYGDGYAPHVWAEPVASAWTDGDRVVWVTRQ